MPAGVWLVAFMVRVSHGETHDLVHDIAAPGQSVNTLQGRASTCCRARRIPGVRRHQ
jgi:hypothetical protein